MRNSERIIFVPFIHAFGGVERLVLVLSRFLHERNIDHTVACFNQTIELADYADWPIKIHELTPRRNPISEGWALTRYLLATRAGGSPPPLLFDLKGSFYAGILPRLGYHLHLTDPPSLLPSEVSKFSLSLRRAYPSLTNEVWPGLFKMIRGEIVHRINRRGASKALSVTVMTNAIADELRLIYNLDTMIVRPGVAVSKSAPITAGEAVGKLRILSVCRLEPNKRIDWILNALSHLETSDRALSEKIDWCVDIVGDGTQMEALCALAEIRGISERVVFHGRISDEGVEQLFAVADLFLMPAKQGYGLPALEALARGVPVVLHRESGVSEVIEGTPWVEIIENSDDLPLAINALVKRLHKNELKKNNLPKVPDENRWASQICNLCGWM